MIFSLLKRLEISFIIFRSARPIARSSQDDQTNLDRPGRFPELFSGRYFLQCQSAWTMSSIGLDDMYRKSPGANLGTFWSRISTDRPMTIQIVLDDPGADF
ncbi:hypothetical protein MA16_Dca008276 [Dendrobium catenatum]|uniref:Uncharacterized protein n=1 Tax=Dendrobium catenatum TaxID=906689 RepID=A0A2I0X6P8_9ASPA|nr:hypothetical protein MA16_Dca008276 [Dendrobium catenatum]